MSKNYKIIMAVAIFVLLAGVIYYVEVKQKTQPLACKEQAGLIKIGMKRTDVDKLLRKDGGVMSILKDERYIIPNCSCQQKKVTKVNVSFYSAPGRDPQAPPSLKDDDIIFNVSAPYCDYEYRD